MYFSRCIWPNVAALQYISFRDIAINIPLYRPKPKHWHRVLCPLLFAEASGFSNRCGRPHPQLVSFQCTQLLLSPHSYNFLITVSMISSVYSPHRPNCNGIRKFFFFWNPQSWIQYRESGIPLTKNPYSKYHWQRIRNPLCGIQKLRLSWSPLDRANLSIY